MGLELDLAERSGWVVVTVTGRLDATSTPEFEEYIERVLESEPRRLALDVNALVHLSSPGLKILLSALKALHRWNGTLRVVAAGENVRKVLATSGLDSLVDLRDSLDG